MDIAILRGVASYLHQCIPHWNENNCKPKPDGRPDPIQGKEFLALHISEVQGTTEDQGILREVWGFAATITKRIEAVPHDKVTDQIYLERMSGIASLANQVNYAISNRQEVSRAIENEFPTAQTDPTLFKFIDAIRVINPPMLVNRNPSLRVRNEDWFHGTHSRPVRNQQDGPVGVSFTLSFGRLNIEISQTQGNCPNATL